MSAPAVVGLDMSLTATGVAFPSGESDTWSTKYRGVARLAWFRAAITTTVEDDVDLVVLEDYAYHSKGAHSHELGELGGVIRLALSDAGIPWVAVIPSSLKKYATGKGNAGKAEVTAAAIRRLGYASHDDNEADALWLRAMALDHYNHPPVVLPATQREALVKIAWPTVGGREATG